MFKVLLLVDFIEASQYKNPLKGQRVYTKDVRMYIHREEGPNISIICVRN